MQRFGYSPIRFGWILSTNRKSKSLANNFLCPSVSNCTTPQTHKKPRKELSTWYPVSNHNGVELFQCHNCKILMAFLFNFPIFQVPPTQFHQKKLTSVRCHDFEHETRTIFSVLGRTSNDKFAAYQFRARRNRKSIHIEITIYHLTAKLKRF